jgi:ribosomal protein S18 acetylase RimI-like enzyme
MGTPRPPSYSLRRATGADFEFLHDLHWATMKTYVHDTWGWDEPAQERMFAERFEPARYHLILVDDTVVGALAVERQESSIVIEDIKLLPSFQSRGLGSTIIQDVLDEAAARNMPVHLQVLKVNPAHRLYRRLGFEVIGETETHWQMCSPARG